MGPAISGSSADPVMPKLKYRNRVEESFQQEKSAYDRGTGFEEASMTRTALRVSLDPRIARFRFR